MKLHTLQPAPGSIVDRKRIGRGQGSGKGGTSTRGHKGAQSRSGYKQKRGFEGGQLPLQRRLPQFGFKNPNRVRYQPVGLQRIAALAQTHDSDHIDRAFLKRSGLVHKSELYKIVGSAPLTRPLNIEAHAFSATAAKAIESAGGKTCCLPKHA